MIYFYVEISEFLAKGVKMIFKRKVYDKLLEWKKSYSGRYACLLEGARRVGKSTIAEEFAKNEYDSYIVVNFANIADEMLDVFKDITKLDVFFLRLQAETGISLKEHKSVIIFDEIQLQPKVRQAIKFLVKDGRYDYIETGSLISIKKNVQNIVIPSEEHRISVYPMDYEEFMWATKKDPNVIRKIYKTGVAIGNSTNRGLMRDFRLYMAVGGMPQAVEAYIQGENFEYIDGVKRKILDLYFEDLMKIDPTGRLSNIFKAIPSQLALKKKRFVVSSATGKKQTSKDEDRFFELLNSKTVLCCYHVTNPDSALAQTKDLDRFKLYASDTGLFISLMFENSKQTNEIYAKLLSDKLDADLGYLYENVAAQIITASGKELYYHTWQKENSAHYFEIDFLLSKTNKIIPLEIKSSATRNHDSIDQFASKYSKKIYREYLFSQKDVAHVGQLLLKPLYMLPFLLEEC